MEEDLDENALETFRNFGARLSSLTFYDTVQDFDNQLNNLLSRHFPGLRHLGVHLSRDYLELFPSRFSADLRSLYLSSPNSRWGLVEMLKRVRRDCPKLAALYLDTTIANNLVLQRISELKNLRFLHITLNVEYGIPEGFLDNLPKLIALRLNLSIQNISRSTCFRGLVHLSLYVNYCDYGSIGFLTTIAPRLRSLNLDYPTGHSVKLSQEIGCQLLKIAHNGILEHLNVPRASFTVEMLDQLIRLCPNLRSFVVQLGQNEHLSQVAELSHVVADQWRAGTRKYLPLRIWFYCHPDTSWRYQNPFLAIHIAPYQYGFTPPNPVLVELFRDEVFNDNDIGGTPTFVTELYSKNI